MIVTDSGICDDDSDSVVVMVIVTDSGGFDDDSEKTYRLDVQTFRRF